MVMMKKKFIEYLFPIESVGNEGQSEKQSAVGRIPQIHIYFARRPTSAARAIILSSILDFSPLDENINDVFNLIEKYGKKHIPDTIKYKKKKIRIIDAIKTAFSEQEINPKELKCFDPFAGGGTFPLEMRHLGLDSYASDLNPVAVLIEKATCEYPQAFGHKLIDEIEIYYNKILKILQRKLENIYKNEVHPENNINLFVWSRQIKCSECDLWIPMIRQPFLSKKYLWGLIPRIPLINKGNDISFSIGWPVTFNGYYSRGKVTCPRCGKTHPKEIVMKFVSEQNSERLLVLYENIPDANSNAQGSFRLPNEKEIQNANINRDILLKEIMEEYPDLDLSFQEKVTAWGIQNYGITSVLRCFNSRQLLVLKTIMDAIKSVEKEIKKRFGNSEFYKAIILYLVFGLTKVADFNSTLTELKTSSSPAIRNTFKRAGLFMVGLYIESNPLLNTTGGWLKYLESLKRVLKNLISQPKIRNNLISIKQMDAMDLEYEDESMDFCFTDPPYYDNISYAASTDFFYVWFKAILNKIFPNFFLTLSTPKETEIVQDSFRQGGSKEAKLFYEEGMAKAFSEIYRVLKKEGLAVIIFAHKDTKAWETLLQAVIDSKLIITTTWPLLMEMKAGMRSMNVVSLDSVIILICRKQLKIQIEYFDENFRQDLEQKIRTKLERQWRLEFRGADFFLSALGPAIEELSRYKAVLDVKTDQPIKITEYLKFIDKILVNFSLEKTLGHEASTTDAVTQLYLIWRQSYKLARLPYDEVWKFTHALGLDDKKLEGKLLKKVRVKSKTVYQCLDAIDKHKEFMEKNFSPSSLIEALQYTSILWSENIDSLDDFIDQYLKKYGDEFWHVAQAIINLMPDTPESKLFIGLMRKYGKVVIKTSKDNKKDKENIQQTFVIEGNNIILKNKISEKEKKSK